MKTVLFFHFGGLTKLRKKKSAFSQRDQLEMFKDYVEKLKGLVGEERTSTIISKSIIFVVQGSNDITNTYYVLREGQNHDFASYADFLVTSASSFLKVVNFNCHAHALPFRIPNIH